MPIDTFSLNIINKDDNTDVSLSFKALKDLIRTGDHSALHLANTLIRKNPNEIVFKVLRCQLILPDNNKTQEINLFQENIKRYFYDVRGNKS